MTVRKGLERWVVTVDGERTQTRDEGRLGWTNRKINLGMIAEIFFSGEKEVWNARDQYGKPKRCCPKRLEIIFPELYVFENVRP